MIKNKAYLKHIASLPCCLCPEDHTGWHDPTVIPHHLLSGVHRGTALKPSDNETIPTCFRHHKSIHDKGEDAEYLQEHGINGPELAEKLWREYNEMA